MTSEATAPKFLDEVRAAVAEARDERMRAIPLEPLRVLAIVPAWTRPLAAAVLHARVDDLVARLEQNGLARIERLPTSSTNPLVIPTVIGTLGTLAPEKAVAGAIEAIRAMDNASLRSAALAELAPAVPSSMASQVLSLASA